VALDPRSHQANQTAVGAMLAARPHLQRLEPSRAAVEVEERTLLHAGPPMDWAGASGPMRGALIGAVLHEGWADTPERAVALLADGDVHLEPGHHHGVVGPMAGVVSPSMPMLVVQDQVSGVVARCTLNEGLGKVLRFGAYDREVLDRLDWIQRVLAPILAAAIDRAGPLDVRRLIAEALQMGDDAHNRNRAGTGLLLRELLTSLVTVDTGTLGLGQSDLLKVLDVVNRNDHFFLNVVMPAAKVTADSARDVPGSSLVVAMARNGTEFGLQLSGTGDEWFTGPAAVPDGLYFPGFDHADANPDMGDSTITETIGIGAVAMAAAPAIVGFVGGEVADAMEMTLSTYQITMAESDAYQIPILGFRGSPVGIDVTLVARTGVVPTFNTGIAGRIAGTGQVGAGLVKPPVGSFVEALDRLAQLAQPRPVRGG
jgi:hypothetical protein